MKTITKEIFMHKSLEYGYEGVALTDLSDMPGYINIGKGTATIELIEEDQRLVVVEKLEEKKRRMMADHQLEIEKVDEQIQSLLALTHQE